MLPWFISDRKRKHPTFVLASYGAECYRNSFPNVTLGKHPTFIFSVIRSRMLPSFIMDFCYKCWEIHSRMQQHEKNQHFFFFFFFSYQKLGVRLIHVCAVYTRLYGNLLFLSNLITHTFGVKMSAKTKSSKKWHMMPNFIIWNMLKGHWNRLRIQHVQVCMLNYTSFLIEKASRFSFKCQLWLCVVKCSSRPQLLSSTWA